MTSATEHGILAFDYDTVWSTRNARVFSVETYSAFLKDVYTYSMLRVHGPEKSIMFNGILFNLSIITPLFRRTLNEAALHFNILSVVFKTICDSLKIEPWPCETLRVLDALHERATRRKLLRFACDVKHTIQKIERNEAVKIPEHWFTCLAKDLSRRCHTV